MTQYICVKDGKIIGYSGDGPTTVNGVVGIPHSGTVRLGDSYDVVNGVITGHEKTPRESRAMHWKWARDEEFEARITGTSRWIKCVQRDRKDKMGTSDWNALKAAYEAAQ